MCFTDSKEGQEQSKAKQAGGRGICFFLPLLLGPSDVATIYPSHSHADFQEAYQRKLCGPWTSLNKLWLFS